MQNRQEAAAAAFGAHVQNPECAAQGTTIAGRQQWEKALVGKALVVLQYREMAAFKAFM